MPRIEDELAGFDGGLRIRERLTPISSRFSFVLYVFLLFFLFFFVMRVELLFSDLTVPRIVISRITVRKMIDLEQSHIDAIDDSF